MKFWEAMKALEEGKKVRCKRWALLDYIDKYTHESMEVSFAVLNSIDEEWEIFEEPQKTYTFQEVVKGLKEGKRFRRMAWTNPYYYIFNGIVGIMEDNKKTPWRSYPEDFEATDWIEIE